ncbi:kinase-like domain-containing protein [Daldinia grandis]|nr:kinase-like domain-containing protein [Daldinia grandis]
MSSNRHQNRPYGSNLLLRRLMRRLRVESRSGEDPSFLRARRSLRMLEENFEKNLPGRTKFQRVLGHGGFGLATLWKVKTQSGRDLDVAVKTSIRKGNEENELRSEIFLQGELLRGAEHIVQLIDIEENVPVASKLYNNGDALVPVMIMEVLQKATLADLIDRINKARLTNYDILEEAESPWAEGRYDRNALQVGYIPNRILWRLFLCLARGVTGMAYGPPTAQSYKLEKPYREGVRDREIKQLLHMDLDIYNVLVGDISHSSQDTEHSVSPKIKIADFGIAIQWFDGMPVPQRERYLQRGKREFYAPEQKDHYNSARDPFAIGPPINVWAIGLIMLNLLTLAHPRVSLWEARVRTYLAPRQGNPDYQQEFVTWGWFLIDHEEHHPSPFIMGFDLELRMLIARCLETYGPRRPTPGQLLAVIEENIARADAKAQRLADARIAQEEHNYRQYLIDEERKEAEAMEYSDDFDPDFDESRRYGHSTRPRKLPPDDPMNMNPTELNQWLHQLAPEAPIPIFGNTRTAVKRPPPLIPISENTPNTDPWDFMIGGPRPAPPIYDPVPIYERQPVAGPSNPTPGPSVVNPVPQPPRPNTPAAQKIITRNDYRPIAEFQTPPELEDADLLVKFYNDHLHDPPPRTDPYAKLWDKSSAEPSITNQPSPRTRPHVRFQKTPVPPGGIPTAIWNSPLLPGYPPAHHPVAKEGGGEQAKEPVALPSDNGEEATEATLRPSPHVRFEI